MYVRIHEQKTFISKYRRKYNIIKVFWEIENKVGIANFPTHLSV